MRGERLAAQAWSSGGSEAPTWPTHHPPSDLLLLSGEISSRAHTRAAGQTHSSKEGHTYTHTLIRTHARTRKRVTRACYEWAYMHMYMRVCDAAWAPSSGVASAYANITMSMIGPANAVWRTQQSLRVKAGRVGATKGENPA